VSRAHERVVALADRHPADDAVQLGREGKHPLHVEQDRARDRGGARAGDAEGG
jgi:hypothetical protein